MTDQNTASPEEQRALSQEELGFADQTRQPAVTKLSGKELSDLISLLRDRRNRARDIASRQGREARGKADPSGATPATTNVGTLSKADYLGAALDRAMAEREGRNAPQDASSDNQPTQTELSQKAMDLKSAAQQTNPMMEDGSPLHPNDPDADPGKKGLAATERNTAPSGALDHAGDLPSRERSRTRH